MMSKKDLQNCKLHDPWSRDPCVGYNCNRLFAGNDVYQQCCWFVMNKTVFTGEYLFDIDN